MINSLVSLCVAMFCFHRELMGIWSSYISFVFVQFATNLKEVLDNWNIGTILWLRRYVEPVSVQAAQPWVTTNLSVHP